MLIFKICHEDEWSAAERAGVYHGTAKDRLDGFLHFSAEDQLISTLEKWYAAAHDLLLVAVDADTLGGALKWEPSRDGALFPHLYASLALSAVKWTGNIARVQAYVQITHTFNSDLQIDLQSPAGTLVTLSANRGDFYDDVFNGTLFRKDSPNPIATYPF